MRLDDRELLGLSVTPPEPRLSTWMKMAGLLRDGDVADDEEDSCEARITFGAGGWARTSEMIELVS